MKVPSLGNWSWTPRVGGGEQHLCLQHCSSAGNPLCHQLCSRADHSGIGSRVLRHRQTQVEQSSSTAPAGAYLVSDTKEVFQHQ